MAAAPVDPFFNADDNSLPAADASLGMQQPETDIMDLMAGDGAGGRPAIPAETTLGGMSPQPAADPFAGMPVADPGMSLKVGITEMTPLREWEDKHERELEEAQSKEDTEKKERRRVAGEAIQNFYEERQAGIKAKQGKPHSTRDV